MTVNICFGWKYLWKHYVPCSEFSSSMLFSTLHSKAGDTGSIQNWTLESKLESLQKWIMDYTH